MSTGFDPYQQWLSIPPAEQPPNHYRLLGLAPFEANSATIRAAGGNLSSYLQQFVDGEHRSEATRLMREITTAVNCLCSSHTKDAYDQQLRSSFPPSAAPVAQAIAPTAAPAPMAAPMATPLGPAPASTPAARVAAVPVAPAAVAAPMAGQPHVVTDEQATDSATTSGSAAARYAQRRKKSNLLPILTLFLICGAIVGGGLAWMAFTPGSTIRRSSDQTPKTAGSQLVFEWKESERANAKLHIDGHARKIPSTGPIRFSAKPGAHRITIQRQGFMPIQVPVTTQLNDERVFEIVWKPAPKKSGGSGRFKDIEGKAFPTVGGSATPPPTPTTEPTDTGDNT